MKKSDKETVVPNKIVWTCALIAALSMYPLMYYRHDRIYSAEFRFDVLFMQTVFFWAAGGVDAVIHITSKWVRKRKENSISEIKEEKAKNAAKKLRYKKPCKKTSQYDKIFWTATTIAALSVYPLMYHRYDYAKPREYTREVCFVMLAIFLVAWGIDTIIQGVIKLAEKRKAKKTSKELVGKLKKIRSSKDLQ